MMLFWDFCVVVTCTWRDTRIVTFQNGRWEENRMITNHSITHLYRSDDAVVLKSTSIVIATVWSGVFLLWKIGSKEKQKRLRVFLLFFSPCPLSLRTAFLPYTFLAKSISDKVNILSDINFARTYDLSLFLKWLKWTLTDNRFFPVSWWNDLAF